MSIATQADWRPMTDAPRNRKILLRYDRTKTHGPFTTQGSWCDARYERYPGYWKTDRLMGLMWMRENQPAGWREIPRGKE